MSITRSPRRTTYTVIDNAVIEDERLNAESMGLLVYLLSKPDNWSVRTEHLMARYGTGRNRIYKLLKALRDYGYAEYSRDSSGKTHWDIYESPRTDPRVKNGDEAKKPRVKNPHEAFGDVLVNTERAVITERAAQEPCQNQTLGEPKPTPPPVITERPQRDYSFWKPSGTTVERLKMFHHGITDQFINDCLPEFIIYAESHYRPDVLDTKFFKSAGSDWRRHNLNASRKADQRKTKNEGAEMPSNPDHVMAWAADNGLPQPYAGESMEAYKSRLQRLQRDAA